MGRDAMVGADGAWTEERGSGVRLTVDAAEVRDLDAARKRRMAVEDVDFYFGCGDAIMGLQAMVFDPEPGEAATDRMAEFDHAHAMARVVRIGRELASIDVRAREILRETFGLKAWDVALRAALPYPKTNACMAWVACRTPAAVRAMVAKGKAMVGDFPVAYAVQEFLTWEARNGNRRLFDDGIRSEARSIVDWAVDAYSEVRDP